MKTYSVFMEADFCIRVAAESEEEAKQIARNHFNNACDDYEMDNSRVIISSVYEED
ncbi:hypothetical protein [Rodentibacter abscessus]|uniref:hypothetical protein n=1 Tax=Rodentibacter abscessus TaxID=3381777 RepID=UPI00399CF32C